MPLIILGRVYGIADITTSTNQIDYNTILMEKFWEKALKVTGPVAVVGLLIFSLQKLVFREDVVTLFGSEKLFVIVLILLSILAIALITSILVYKGRGSEKRQHPTHIEGNKTIINRSKIRGDVISGNKYVNTKDKNA